MRQKWDDLELWRFPPAVSPQHINNEACLNLKSRKMCFKTLKRKICHKKLGPPIGWLKTWSSTGWRHIYFYHPTTKFYKHRILFFMTVSSDHQQIKTWGQAVFWHREGRRLNEIYPLLPAGAYIIIFIQGKFNIYRGSWQKVERGKKYDALVSYGWSLQIPIGAK